MATAQQEVKERPQQQQEVTALLPHETRARNSRGSHLHHEPGFVTDVTDGLH